MAVPVLSSMRLRFTRGLRFRLTLTYVIFFTLLLSVLGLFFRETLRSIYDRQAREVLDQEWGAVKGYLRIEKNRPTWYYDPEDPEEAFIVERLRQVYLLTDAKGKMMEVSPKYQSVGMDTPEEIRDVLKHQTTVWRVKRDDHGTPYVIRSGTLIDDNRKSFYVAIGRSLLDANRVVEQFTFNYFLLMPLMIVASAIVGWLMAGRSLMPVNEVAYTAQRITGSNLTARIPLRGAADELDRLIEAFNRMIERLEASFTMTRQFSTDVSHELRTPLTAIRGQLEVALFAAQGVEQYRDAIVNALEDVERLSQTIRALLLLSQAESGQVMLQKQHLDLAAVAADVVDQFQIPAEGARLQLTADIPGECTIEADRIQIERLLSNLLSNSIKYTPEGGSIRVAVRQHSPGFAEIIVEDTGVGIQAGHLPHIFDRFYRVPSADRNPERGLGLGLSFVAWIVKAHGGRIDVQSAVGEGTRFNIVLPVGVPAHSSESMAVAADRS